MKRTVPSEAMNAHIELDRFNATLTIRFTDLTKRKRKRGECITLSSLCTALSSLCTDEAAGTLKIDVGEFREVRDKDHSFNLSDKSIAALPGTCVLSAPPTDQWVSRPFYVACCYVTLRHTCDACELLNYCC